MHNSAAEMFDNYKLYCRDISAGDTELMSFLQYTCTVASQNGTVIFN